MAELEGKENDIMAPIRASVVRYYSLLAGAAILILLLTAPLRGEGPIVIGSYLSLLVLFGVAYRIRFCYPMFAGALCCLGPFILVSLMVWVRGGMVNPAAITSYITLLLITGLCWNSTGTLVIAALNSAILAYFVFYGPEDPPYNKLQQWGELAIQMLIVFGIVRLTLRALARSARDTIAHQKRFQDAIEGSPDGIIGLDANKRVQLFNQKAAAMSRSSKDDARGKHLAELNWLNTSAIKRIEDAMLDSAEGIPHAPFEVSTNHDDLLEISVSLVARHKNEPDRLITIRDVTERRRALQAQEALEARLAHSKSIDALGRLAGGVAHDFNNLLTVISGTAELMRRKENKKGTDGPLRPDLDLIEGAAERAAKLTSQLLAFGRKQVLQPTILCPNTTLKQLEPLLSRLVPASIEMRLQCSTDVANVKVDEARLEQVIVNLVSNASDAMRDGGQLIIGTRLAVFDERDIINLPEARPGKYVEIFVRDTGVGIDEETLPRLFEPFFTTKDPGRGTGLGLAMVHGIVAQSGGFSSVESELGKGTCFRVFLPQSTEPVSKRNSELKEGPHDARQARVLLVEDEPGVRASTKRMLEALGYTVEEAEDGKQALDEFGPRIDDFEILITDVVMPSVSGPELAESLALLKPDLRILYISGYTETAIVQDGILEDGVHYLPKPFKMKALASTLHGLSRP